MTTAVSSTTLDGLKLVQRGKVRDIYEVGEDLLLVATDRLSAYDVVLSPAIPFKGEILTRLSLFWFDQLSDLTPNHLITADVDAMPPEVRAHRSVLAGRSMLVKRLKMAPVECVVRGYLVGSGWKDYTRTGAVCGHALPAGLEQSCKLAPPLFTPATKAEEGHDENIDFDTMISIVGKELAEALRTVSKAVYERARSIAAERGVIIADTKFEFGADDKGTLTLGDEVLTPDSSRFWDASLYAPGKSQKSFDKQLVRNWLDDHGWDRNPPAPTLPDEVVQQTSNTYREIYERLTGSSFTSQATSTSQQT